MAAAQKTKRPQYITPAGLRGKRYWTDGMIRDLLGEPDKLARNPHFSTAAPMRLYLVSRVDAMEATLDLDRLKKNRERRSAAGQKAVLTREENAIRDARECDLGCSFTEPLPVVMAKGAESNREIVEYHREQYEEYVWRCERRGETPQPRLVPSHPGVDAECRWAVNYLRHERTDYDDLLYRMGDIARHDLRMRIHERIGRAYPELREAAMRLV